MRVVVVLACLFFVTTNAIELLDLTYTLKEDIPHWSPEEQFRVHTIHNGTHKDGYWFKLESISTGTHMATHLDAPCHFSQNGWCVSDIPIQRLVAPAVVVDIAAKVGDNGDTYLTPSDLWDWESRNGFIPDGSVLLVRTGWGRYWTDKTKYWGTQVWDIHNLSFPGVGEDAARWLVDNRRIYGLGVDTISVDYGRAPTPRVHQIMASRNVYNLENLAGLERVPARGATLYVMPMKIEGASGAPARLLAVVETTANSCSALP